MTDLETRLERALKADDPAPRDPKFRIEILMRRERMVFRRKLVTAFAMVIGATILGSLSLVAIGKLFGAGPERLELIAAVGVLATAVLLLVAPRLGALDTLRSSAGAWAARPGPRR
jgi:hypothetical protein